MKLFNGICWKIDTELEDPFDLEFSEYFFYVIERLSLVYKRLTSYGSLSICAFISGDLE